MDITAALLHDTEPLFPLPILQVDNNIAGKADWTTLPPPLLQIACDNCTYNQRLLSVVACIGELSAIAALIRNDTATSDSAVWSEEGNLSSSINQLTHNLLRQRPLCVPLTAPEITAEALRLGALVLIIYIKRKCRSYPSNAEERISTLLKLLAYRRDANGTTIWDTFHLRLVRSWLLVLCNVCEPNSTNMAISTAMIASDFAGMGHILWTETMAAVREMPWLDSFEPLLAELEHRLFGNRLGPYPLVHIVLDQ